MTTLFPGVTRPSERAYLLAYWRWLLGWSGFPSAPRTIPRGRRVALRLIARAATMPTISPGKMGKVLAFPKPSA